MGSTTSSKRAVRPKVKPSKDLPTLPRMESTYTQIILRAVGSARGEKTLGQKIRGFTRELSAVVPVTRQKWTALSVLGKLLTLVLTFSLGVGATLLVLRVRAGSDPDELRHRISHAIDEHDYVSAKKLLHTLAGTPGGLSDADRQKLVGPVQAALGKQQHDLEDRLDGQIAKKEWDLALVTLDEAERLDVKSEWTLWQRAEVLRSAGRKKEAAAAYGRYVELFPRTDHADDALFWEAEALKTNGDMKEAKEVLEQLLREYPTTDFRSSARRWLAEMP